MEAPTRASPQLKVFGSWTGKRSSIVTQADRVPFERRIALRVGLEFEIIGGMLQGMFGGALRGLWRSKSEISPATGWRMVNLAILDKTQKRRLCLVEGLRVS